MEIKVTVEDCEHLNGRITYNVSLDDITLLSEICDLCGKEVDLLEKPHVISHSFEIHSLTEEELTIKPDYAESLFHFCSEECYKKFLDKIKNI